ncbi:MAG: hypothetical protein AVDCRST_MAG20-2023, partial [uncultured Acidimicrobiales bacterium]
GDADPAHVRRRRPAEAGGVLGRGARLRDRAAPRGPRDVGVVVDRHAHPGGAVGVGGDPGRPRGRASPHLHPAGPRGEGRQEPAPHRRPHPRQHARDAGRRALGPHRRRSRTARRPRRGAGGHGGGARRPPRGDAGPRGQRVLPHV